MTSLLHFIYLLICVLVKTGVDSLLHFPFFELSFPVKEIAWKKHYVTSKCKETKCGAHISFKKLRQGYQKCFNPQQWNLSGLTREAL